jgi:monoterpene epsilon-lactone hydrolase
LPIRRVLAVVCAPLVVALLVGGCQQSWPGTDGTDRVAAVSAAEPPPQVLVAGVTSEVFSSAKKVDDPQVLFIHGGSYVHEASALHAPFFGDLLDAVDATITMPVYALAPEHGYQVAYTQVQDVYLELRRSHPDSPIVLMGGSAGGGLALGFAQTLLEQGLPQPDRIVLLSPWLDLTLTNPEIERIDPSDVLLDRDALVPNGLAWAHGDDPSDYRLSPVTGPLEGLAPTTVLAGTNDILYPDTQVLETRARAAGLDFELVSFAGADHIFVMSPGEPGDKARAIVQNLIDQAE